MNQPTAVTESVDVASKRIAQRAVRSAAGLLDNCGLMKLSFLRRRSLRILCYHGVCPDEAVGQPWVPTYFVTASQFARQMHIAQRFGPVVHLPDVLASRCGARGTREPALAVTFDDVAACTFRYARPVLNRLGIRASFFVSSGPVSTGCLFNADLLNLLTSQPELAGQDVRAPLTDLIRHPARHKAMTANQLAGLFNDLEPRVRKTLDPTVYQNLRPVNWEEVRQLASDGHEIGGHTVDHVVLGAQTDAVRAAQIREGILAIKDRLNCEVIGFAYPNGGPGDFGPQDQAVLREMGIAYALTTRTGFAAECHRYEVPRAGIGMGHSPEKFALELSGLLDRRRERQQGWR
ncbi:MAG: polysaccharide deacetylase family protein [Phycisphaerae bacterium]